MDPQPELKQQDEELLGVTTTPVLGTGINGASSYADIPETKTFYPTLDEFASPLVYIQSIRDEAMKYGIIKIKPPPGTVHLFLLTFPLTPCLQILAPIYNVIPLSECPMTFQSLTVQNGNRHSICHLTISSLRPRSSPFI